MGSSLTETIYSNAVDWRAAPAFLCQKLGQPSRQDGLLLLLACTRQLGTLPQPASINCFDDKHGLGLNESVMM